MPDDDEDLDDYDRGLANEMEGRPIYPPSMMAARDVLDDHSVEISGDPETVGLANDCLDLI